MKKSTSKKIRIGIVGTGGMANAHALEFHKIPGVTIAAVCDIDPARAQEFSAKHTNGRAAAFSDHHEMFARGEIDAISNVTPDAFHAPVSLAAISAGLHVLCEKPLATCHADALKMAKAAKKAGVVNMVNFSYRNCPAIQLARDLATSGRLGDIVHIEASYLQSWLVSKRWGDWRTSPGWLWRLSTKHGSKGVLGDIGVHILDFASMPVGPIRAVNAKLKAFPNLKGRRQGNYTLDANDSAVLQVEFENGALGAIHTTRWATGKVNSLALAIHGTQGALRIDLDKSPDTLEACLGGDVEQSNWKTLKAKPTRTIYRRFIDAIRTGTPGEPDFARGAEIQKALDACFTSDTKGAWVRV